MANLTTTAAVKSYLGISNTNQDTLIAALIARATSLIENFTGKTFPTVQNVSKLLDGTGTQVLVMPDFPILEVSLLKLGVTSVSASVNGSAAGYVVDENSLTLVGQTFPLGKKNVTCSWNAGYRESEVAFIPTGNAPTLTPTTGGTAVTAVSVTNAAGVAYTQVGSSPAAAQFSFAAGVFSFNTANVGAQVSMEYAYVPAAVEQACIETVALKLKQRDTIGVQSKSLAGETIAYRDQDMSTSAKAMLQPYRKNSYT